MNYYMLVRVGNKSQRIRVSQEKHARWWGLVTTLIAARNARLGVLPPEVE